MAVFIDTSFFIALLNEKDKFNERAREIAREIFPKEKLYTSDYVLDELFTFVHKLGHSVQKETLAKINKALFETGILEIEFVGAEHFDITKHYFALAPDVASFTDWTSAVLMMQKDISKIASFDSDFDKISNFDEFKGMERVF